MPLHNQHNKLTVKEGGGGGGVLAMSQAQALCRVWYLTLYNGLMRVCVFVWQGTYCTGKTGKMVQKFPVRENTGNLEILPKHRENTGNLVCSICKFPDSKGKRYFDIRSENFQCFLKLNMFTKSVWYM